MPSPTRARLIAYWVITVLVALSLLAGGAADVMRTDDVVAGMTHLGYPLYFVLLLGVWKLLGAAALLAPGVPRLKEWAYAGIVFDFTGALVSHLAVGDPANKLIAPVLLTALTVASWALRPPARTLAGPSI